MKAHNGNLAGGSGTNRIEFGAGITADSIRASYNNATGHLTLYYGTGTDSVTLADGLSGNTVSSYRFADGSALTHAELMKTALQSLTYYAGDGNDTLQGEADLAANDHQWRVAA